MLSSWLAKQEVSPSSFPSCDMSCDLLSSIPPSYYVTLPDVFWGDCWQSIDLCRHPRTWVVTRCLPSPLILCNLTWCFLRRLLTEYRSLPWSSDISCDSTSSIHPMRSSTTRLNISAYRTQYNVHFTEIINPIFSKETESCTKFTCLGKYGLVKTLNIIIMTSWHFNGVRHCVMYTSFTGIKMGLNMEKTGVVEKQWISTSGLTCDITIFLYLTFKLQN